MSFVGPVGNPIFWGTKKEISELCNSEFYYYYDIWRKFHIGLGLPCGKSYIHEQPDIVDIVTEFEWLYRVKEGIGIISQKIDGIGEYLKAGFKLKTR